MNATAKAKQSTPEIDIEKPLSFYEIEKETSGPIFVLNNSDGSERGSVSFEVPKTSGVGADSVTVPATWLPIDLLTIVNREQLLKSSEFKRALNPMVPKSGRAMLVIIHPKLAERMMNEPGAKEEAALIKQSENASFEINQREVEVVHAHQGQKEAQDAAARKVVEAGPSAKVQQLIDALTKGDNSEIHVLNSLRSMGTLSQADHRFILANAAKSNESIIAFAKSKIKP